MNLVSSSETQRSVLPQVAAELVAFRREAVEGRNASEIEEKWFYAENAYNGEDEATQGSSRVYKPATLNGPFIHAQAKEWNRSTAFLNITRPYVDSASARVGDMLFPTDERNFEIRPTPKADIEPQFADLRMVPDEALPLLMEQIQGEVEKAILSVEDAQKQIDDWLNESAWNAVGRDMIADAARVGTGVVKGPVPMLVKGRIQPGSKLIKVQNCFPDPNCGDDIHNGEYFFERSEITARKLRQKLKMESAGWLPGSIKSCLEEGPKQYNGTLLSSNGKPAKLYELWHFQGEVSVEALEESGCSPSSDAGEKMWANVTLCNDSIVRVSIAPLQDRFTYCVFRWQKRNGNWAGIGVGEQIETPQRGLNAGERNLFDNAALSALPQLIYWKNIIVPVNGRFEIEPGKIWEVADEELDLDEVKNAIMTIEIPTRQGELMNIIALMRDVAQETTGLPLIAQGMVSTGAVGTDQLQTNSANTVLRRLAKDFDADVTVPHISGYYDWIKEFEVLDVPEAIVDARGSSALVERDIQAQALIQMVQLSKDPAYEIDPKLVMSEWMKSQKFDPRKVALSAERKQELVEAMSQPDEKAQAQIASAQTRAEALTLQAETEAETDRAELLMKQEDAERERLHDKTLLDLKYKYELVKYAMEQQIDVGAASKQLEEIGVPDVVE